MSGVWLGGGRTLTFVPARCRTFGGDIAPAIEPTRGSIGIRGGFERVGWRDPSSSPFGRMLAFDGARARRVVAPGGGILCATATGLAANGSEGRADIEGGARALGTIRGSEGPGLEGNGTFSVLGRPSDLASGLGTRSGLLSPLRTLKDEADDGARARPVTCGGGAGLLPRGAGLFWRVGPWDREYVRGGLCTAGGAFTRFWSFVGSSAATVRGDWGGFKAGI